MPRERRSLWRSISTSKKVNKLSLKAALLYTWAIPHFDDEGFMDGDLRTMKHEIVPYRREFTSRTIKNVCHELKNEGLWIIHEIKNSIFIQDPAFSDYQTFKGIHKIPSKIRPLIKQEKISTTPNGVYDDTDMGEQGENKLREVKLREEKLSKEENPSFSPFKDKPPPGYDLVSGLAEQKAIPNSNDVQSRREFLKKQAEELSRL